MEGIIDNIDRRTKLAGNNRFELLTFYLGNDKQLYGINVFKVQEVIICPQIRKVPDSMPFVDGIVDIRGTTLPVIDLSMAIGKTQSSMEKQGFLIVSEYNKHIQGFRVSGVDRIVNLNWDEIKPPPRGLGRGCYLTAITEVDNKFVEIIDVEKVISELNLVSTDISDKTRNLVNPSRLQEKFVLIADDSVVARKQISTPLELLGIKCIQTSNGKEALDYLVDLADNHPEDFDRLGLLISDVEMPIMDGYALVSEIKKSDKLNNLYIILHSSLSGEFNEALVEKVGADNFIAKYDPDILSRAVVNVLEK